MMSDVWFRVGAARGVANKNDLIAFLRHYGPISASDNMYDELIQTEIDHYKIEPPIHIPPARLSQIRANFEKPEPSNIILTGTAGDGKTYHCRRIWEEYGGNREEWQRGTKIVSIRLPASPKTLTIVKDLSELTPSEKASLLPDLAAAITRQETSSVFLVAANDGQLLATWREWAEPQGDAAYRDFKTLESMLIEERTRDDSLELDLYNLSRLDASQHFHELMEQVLEHPQWAQCQGCELLKDDGTTSCPIRLNRERLRGDADHAPFRRRLGDLLRLSRINRMHLPIRDLLLLAVNILLGDRQYGRILLTCRAARNRANAGEYSLTNPYANVFGSNLPRRKRQQYHAFMTLEAFGIGRETDNRFDNLLIYGGYSDSDRYERFVGNDSQYGAPAYRPYLRDYLEGQREEIDEFMRALMRQRQRLFFSLPPDSELDPWRLSVYQTAGTILDFSKRLVAGKDVSRTVELLVRGLNRTFCGMMIDDGTQLYLTSSGGDGRGRIASILKYELATARQRRHPYVTFRIAEDNLTPRLLIIDPAGGQDETVDSLDLQLTHFEYLVRVANGSLPASFSRQCYEDFLDFKLRLIERLNHLIGEEPSRTEINLQALTVDERGRAQPDNIRLQVGVP